MSDAAPRPPRACPVRVEALAPAVERQASADACSSGESFALMVLGDSMLPEFAEGEVVVIEPDGLVVDAMAPGEILRLASNCPGSRADVQDWARVTGCRLEEVVEVGPHDWEFYIRKA